MIQARRIWLLSIWIHRMTAGSVSFQIDNPLKSHCHVSRRLERDYISKGASHPLKCQVRLTNDISAIAL
jgi:hypothetical protein